MTVKKYRTRTEILVQLLQVAASVNNGISITRLMYGTFVPRWQVKEYLDLLIQNGLLEHDLLARTYKTTEKGIKVIELFEKLQELTAY
jgi:predicted transcriptional regulator